MAICEIFNKFALEIFAVCEVMFLIMKRYPINKIKPGEFIKNELRERRISQKEFAEAVGVGESHISDILSGRRRITHSLASKIEDLLGIDSNFILDMQTANDIICECKAKSDSSEFDAKIKLNSIDEVVSVKTLLKFLKKKFKTNVSKLEALNQYYGLSSETCKTVALITQGCYRKSSTTGMDRRMILSWVVLARAISCVVKPIGKFAIEKMNELCEEVVLELHRNGPSLIKRLMDLLSVYGIGLLRIDKVERASIDGYSFYNNGIPYIALTCRYDRIDNLAFTIMHELAHIALGHTTENRSQLNIDRRSYDEDYSDTLEEQANQYASEMLIPTSIWKFAPTISANPFLIKSKYNKWAESKNLNPWIVLGRLSYETGIYKFPADDSRKINGGKEVCHELT